MWVYSHNAPFFVLLRAGLWGVPEGMQPPLSGALPWKDIYRDAVRQTQLVTLLDGAEAIRAARVKAGLAPLDPPEAFVLRAYAMRLGTEEMIARSCAVLDRVQLLLAGEGIACILLKGLGAASRYPRPGSRSCGDIDLLVKEADYPRACELLSALGKVEEETPKHLGVEIDGIPVELHRRSTIPYRPASARAFRRLEEEVWAQTRSCTLPGSLRTQVPSLRFDALFILSHLVNHFLDVGVGLRQVCDWMMLLWKEEGGLDREQLARDLKETRLTWAWKAFGYIAVRYLGLPEEKMPLYDSRSAHAARKVLSLVMEGGNFGHYADGLFRHDASDTYARRKAKSLGTTLSRSLRKWDVCPVDTFFYLGRYFRRSIRDFLRRK